MIIPHQNVQNLMLRTGRRRGRQGKGNSGFYPIETIDEGIEILTGIPAGSRRADGTFEEGTVNFLVDRELARLAKVAKDAAAEDKDEKKH